MANPKAAETAAALRSLPSTDELLHSPAALDLLATVGRRRLTALAREAIGSVRRELLDQISLGSKHADVYSRETLLKRCADQLRRAWDELQQRRLRKVINATGVVIHTNLGRAPLSENARAAIAEVTGYCTLEYDISTGRRGRRGAPVEEMLVELTGAQSAVVVNNCAAAAFLVLSVLAAAGEAIVSRGELVEIGGDFRIPDVLQQSGVTLREVGTTNRTKLSDYERAINENTKVLMRVHPSNYRIVGFTSRPTLGELAELARKKKIPLYEDAGSGALTDLSVPGLDDEPLIATSIADGADIVTFSGDKLLGGCQAGLIVGRRKYVESIRKHPLYRALRVDKIAYAVLQATLESYLLETADRDVPVLRMLHLTEAELRSRAEAMAARLVSEVGVSATVEVIDGESVVGGGSAPDVRPATALLSIRPRDLRAGEIEHRLRRSDPAVISRIEANRVLIDLRTVSVNEEDELLSCLVSVLQPVTRSARRNPS